MMHNICIYYFFFVVHTHAQYARRKKSIQCISFALEYIKYKWPRSSCLLLFLNVLPHLSHYNSFHCWLLHLFFFLFSSVGCWLNTCFVNFFLEISPRFFSGYILSYIMWIGDKVQKVPINSWHHGRISKRWATKHLYPFISIWLFRFGMFFFYSPVAKDSHTEKK